MKKPKPRRGHRSNRGKAAQKRARRVSRPARRGKLALGGAAVAAVLLVAGVLAYDAWQDIHTSDSRQRDSVRAFVYEVLSGELAGRRESRPATSRSSPLPGQAKVQIPEENRDLGAMAVSEERSAEFFLRNIGGKPLEISQVRTSCMCTFAQVTIEDEKSPLFNMEMHNTSAIQDWKGVVEPGLTATVRIIYRPSLMPVEGSVARNVKFNTNDPGRPVVELGVHATVQQGTREHGE